MSRALIFGSIQFRLGDEAAKSGKGFADIDFRKHVQRNSAQQHSNQPVCIPPSDSLVTAIEPAKNRLDNIIEKLEKKYSNPITFDDEEESEVEVEVDVSDRDSTSNPTNVTSKKRKRKGQDTYDMGDSFIDDSEAYMEVEKAYASQRIKTKHTGFFVNSGALEVTRTKDQDSSESTDDAAEEVKFKVLKYPEMAAAFDRFRRSVSENTSVKLYRHRFPPSLNEALLQLDAAAQKLALHLEHDYYACISDAMRGVLPANKIKSHLLLCRRHVRVNQAKADIEALCSKFSNYIMQFLRKLEAAEAEKEEESDMPSTQPTQQSQSDNGESIAMFTHCC